MKELDAVKVAAESRRKAEAKESEAVSRAVDAGCSWREIAEAAGRPLLDVMSRRRP